MGTTAVPARIKKSLGELAARTGEAASNLLCERPFQVLGLVAIIATAALTVQVSRVESDLMRAAALRNASHYASALEATRAIYSAQIADRLKHQGFTFDETSSADPHSLPSPESVALMLGNRVAGKDAGGTVRIYSPYRLDDDPVDRFLDEAWARLSVNPTEPYYHYETVNGRASIRYAKAMFVQGECRWCGSLGLGSGDVIGVLEVVRPLDGAIIMARSASLDTFFLTLFITTAGLALVAFLVTRLRHKSDAAEALAGERQHANRQLENEIDQRTRAEQALAVANERLTTNHTTLERWAAELEIAHTRLREIDELKTKFLSEVSHELRSPMAAIVSAAKIIKKHHETKPEVIERFGSTIVSEGARMTRLINDFLDLTKVESGCVDWNDEELAPAELVADAAHNLAALAIDGGIEILEHADIALPELTVDRDRLFQVITNLAGNALKFTPPGGSVTIAAALQDGEVVFSVEDTGPGIPAEDVPKVFDRFHQVRSAKSESGSKGTGLGLCISREIVEHYGGRIWVESRVGVGSAFRFAIPCAAASTRHAADSVDPQTSHAARVLVMLDSLELAARAVSTPSSQGLECRSCRDVIEMESIAASWRPDVFVVSASFVDESGHDVLRRAHEQGIVRILVHSHEHGLTSPAVLDSAELLVPSLRGVVPAGAHVMVAEDDEKYRGILEFELKQVGYRVTTVASGREAIEQVGAEAPDAMILDLVMPDIDGLMVLEHFSDRTLGFPILVYTAMDDPSVALAAKELGATEVFRKDAEGRTTYAAVAARVRRILTPILGEPAAAADDSTYDA